MSSCQSNAASQGHRSLWNILTPLTLRLSSGGGEERHPKPQRKHHCGHFFCFSKHRKLTCFHESFKSQQRDEWWMKSNIVNDTHSPDVPIKNTNLMNLHHLKAPLERFTCCVYNSGQNNRALQSWLIFVGQPGS